MQPEIRERRPFRVLGIERRINPSTADWHDIWERQYMPHDDEIKPHSVDGAWYGVYCGTGDPDLVDMVAGMAVGAEAPLPEGLVAKDVPATTEAVFACSTEEIGATWDHAFGHWLPESDYEHNPDSPCYERFPPEMATGGGNLAIHVSVRRRGQSG